MSPGENAYPDSVKMDLRFELTAPPPKIMPCCHCVEHVCEYHVQ